MEEASSGCILFPDHIDVTSNNGGSVSFNCSISEPARSGSVELFRSTDTRSCSSSQDYPADVKTFNHPALAEECSSSSSVVPHDTGGISINSSTATCPSGPQDYVLNAYPQHHSDFLLVCNPVTVIDSVMDKIRNMILNHWPTVTQAAKQKFPVFAETYEQVKSANLPNFAGAKIPVSSGLVPQNWALLLKDYHDNELCHFLYFGWPIGYLSDALPVSVSDNHPSALAYPNHVDEFINTEITFGAIEGPMADQPFTPWMRISPLMTRPKKGSDTRRTIVDLSYPEGSAVNSAIKIAEYLGRDISYSLPTITDLIARLQQEGKGAFIWKADLAREYRQLRADPVDAPLLGIKHRNKIYVDKCPPFGCRSSSAACQRMANAIVYILAQDEHHCLAYLDDFAGCHADQDQAHISFKAFVDLAEYLGLQLSHNKCFPPATCMEWLGYTIDTMAMTVSIPEPKLAEVIQECERWFSRKRVTRVMVQSLAGKLAYVAGCIRHGRKFLTRILATLRADYHKKWLTINQDFLKDVKWFYLYSKSSNGISLYSTNLPQVVIECDSSLQGAGGNSHKYCYTWTYTDAHKIRFPAIHQMEAVNILVAYRTLAHQHTDDPTSVLILTDNSSSSTALMTGRTKDPILGACARELWLEAARHDDTITIEHRPGTQIPLADALSRMASDPAKHKYVRDTVQYRGLVFVPPVLKNYKFFNGNI